MPSPLFWRPCVIIKYRIQQSCSSLVDLCSILRKFFIFKIFHSKYKVWKLGTLYVIRTAVWPSSLCILKSAMLDDAMSAKLNFLLFLLFFAQKICCMMPIVPSKCLKLLSSFINILSKYLIQIQRKGERTEKNLSIFACHWAKYSGFYLRINKNLK